MQNRIVAIIDDNQDSLRELEIILKMAGYIPVLVNDVLGAVDAVINNKKFRSSRCQIFLKMNLNGLWIFVA